MAYADPSPSDPREDGEARAALAAIGVDIVNRDDLPMFNPDSIAAALVDRSGRVVCQSAAFAATGAVAGLDPDLLDRVLHRGAPLTGVADLAGDAPDSAVFAYALASHATGWRLPPEVRAAAAVHPDHAVVLTTEAIRAAPPLEEACRAHGLSGLQTRVALEVIRTGHVKLAAQRLGVSYNTARVALGEAMQRARVRRLPGLVARLTSVAFGVLPELDSADALGDLWGITPRQAAIAGLVAEGLSRGEAAAALGLSEALVKKELDRVYLTLQVGTAAALARKLVEARALRWLTAATRGDLGFLEPSAEPLQFVHRPDGTRIALSDYGPASGKPVLVVHSSLSSRPVARRLLRALHAAGYRPIAIDRPGFGLTDEVPGAQPGAHDPWAAAADDARRVLEHLRIRQVDVVARGGAKFVIAMTAAAPARLGRIVLANPDPHGVGDQSGVGPIGLMKRAFVRNPAMIRIAIGLLARQITSDRWHDLLHRSLGATPADARAFEDAELVADLFRASRTVATGRFAGVVNEQVDFQRSPPPEPIEGAPWRVLVAARDQMHDPALVLDLWRRTLPDGRIRVVEDAGRYLAFSHPHYVVEALTEA